MSFLKHWLIVMLQIIEVPVSFLRHTFTHKRTTPRKPNAVDVWIATHEAGHTIAAYYAKLCIGIETVSIDEKHGGITAYDIVKTNDAAYHWTTLVIGLSGIAAEIKKYRSIRSKNSSGDLATALNHASELLAIGEKQPPWQIMREHYLPFNKMFSRISDAESNILKSGYAMARAILDMREQELNKLSDYLANNRVIDGKQVSGVLGDITLAKIGNTILNSLQSNIKHNLFY